MLFKRLILHIKQLILSPVKEWTYIQSRPLSQKSLYLHFAFPLITLISLADTISTTKWRGLYTFIDSFVIFIAQFTIYSLTTILFAMIVNELIKSFGGKKDKNMASNLAILSIIPFYLAMIPANLIPDLFFLGLAGLYSIFVFYQGLLILFKINEEKKVGFIFIAFLIFIGIFESLQWIILVSVRALLRII
ncbi:MAG: hypothetical protein C0594_17495 [Marinilabiliales bacterium]|nr:MAG: hypothetical protein C0594_17495 [Marinilabiliales bacterium]